MTQQNGLTQQFEEHRPRLRGVAYRMLGSLSEADDAVQEAWLRLSRTDASSVDNLGGWLTTVVSRVCLDMLRSRKSRREEPIAPALSDRRVARGQGADPEREAVLADSVSVALLVVLNTLTPSERLAFVLHDLFGLPFEEIGPILGRSRDAAKQLASRARRRVRGSPSTPATGLAQQRALVEAFMNAVRNGDLQGLLAVLDPEAVLHIDAAARVDGAVGRVDAPPSEIGKPRELKGAATWAPQLIAMSRMLRFVQQALIDGSVGVILAPGGKLVRALTFELVDGRIARIDAIGDPVRLRELEIAVLQEGTHG
jgi:RNA polymerase sigma factor (sigma-70 family)